MEIYSTCTLVLHLLCTCLKCTVGECYCQLVCIVGIPFTSSQHNSPQVITPSCEEMTLGLGMPHSILNANQDSTYMWLLPSHAHALVHLRMVRYAWYVQSKHFFWNVLVCEETYGATGRIGKVVRTEHHYLSTKYVITLFLLWIQWEIWSFLVQGSHITQFGAEGFVE